MIYSSIFFFILRLHLFYSFSFSCCSTFEIIFIRFCFVYAHERVFLCLWMVIVMWIEDEADERNNGEWLLWLWCGRIILNMNLSTNRLNCIVIIQRMEDWGWLVSSAFCWLANGRIKLKFPTKMSVLSIFVCIETMSHFWYMYIHIYAVWSGFRMANGQNSMCVVAFAPCTNTTYQPTAAVKSMDTSHSQSALHDGQLHSFFQSHCYMYTHALAMAMYAINCNF